MGQCACSCCHNDELDHNKFTVSLDDIKYKDENLLKRGLEQNFGICNVKFDFFKGIVEIGFNPKHITKEEINQALKMPNYILDKNIKRLLGGFIEKHGKLARLIISGSLVGLTWALLAIFDKAYIFPSLKAQIMPLNYVYVLVNFLAITFTFLPTLKGVNNAIKEKKLNVHVLIFIAVVGAILLGDWIEAATVLFITIVGEMLESTALKTAKDEIVIASIASAKYATVKENNVITELPVHKVIKGQIVVVKQGMMVPVDGKIIAGQGQLNEAALTGESTFTIRSQGDKVFAGTILESGSIEIEALSVGEHTKLAHIAKLVEKAREHKTGWEKVVDKFSAYFIPIILVVGLGVTLFAMFVLKLNLITAIERGITILVVACPCALVLSTPTAIHAGIGKAAKLGVLFKNGSIIELFAKANVLLMDKTGTLTYARPAITNIKTFGKISEEEILSIAVTVEKNSMHPLAHAICNYAKDKDIHPGEIDDFMEFEGGGACAKIKNKLYKVGTKWLMDDGREFPDEVTKWLKASEEEGSSSILVADDENIIGAFSITDEVREDALDVLKKLRKNGIEKFVMLTGDNQVIANRVGQALGIEEVIAECMPDTKLNKLEQEKQNNKVVAMVGDGINDAPALAAADIGIAMGAMGSDAAVAAADVSLMDKNLQGLANSFILTKQVLRIIKQNIFFSVFLNLAMVYLVSIGQVNMLAGALVHQVSALVVIFNSYRLLIIRN
ncbi:heavy metal translocating P-type ATPase [Candidatus Margulisiibacteriota bacterium]